MTDPKPEHTPEVEPVALAEPQNPVDTPREQMSPHKLVGNLVAPLAIELGRASFSILEFSKLKPGHIIELHRSPLEPVDLVVGEKMIGKGELVEIEGELGIRILSLVE